MRFSLKRKRGIVTLARRTDLGCITPVEKMKLPDSVGRQRDHHVRQLRECQ